VNFRQRVGVSIAMALLAALLVPAVGAQDPVEPRPAPAVRHAAYVPAIESPIFVQAGAGVGIPYGTMGGRLALGSDHFSVDAGVGLVPFAWEPGFGIGGAIYLAGRTAPVRPKFSAVYSNAVAMIAILQSGSLDALYSQLYDGLATYFGVDWRLGKTSSFCLDIGVGAVFPSAGIDAVKADFDRVRADYARRGYSLRGSSSPRSAPFVSFGLTFSPARAMKIVLSESAAGSSTPPRH